MLHYKLYESGDLALDGSVELFSDVTLLTGDVTEQLAHVADGSCALIVSSPPYNIGKAYEKDNRRTLAEYEAWQSEIIEALISKLAPKGSICWQVGTHVADKEVFPLDIMFVPIFRKFGMKLRNRIIWRYNFGLNADRRFSGRYETMLWLTREGDYHFNLDPVRVPQLYPGKRHGAKKGDKAGKPSGNPLGKNPSDYWEFSAPQEFINNPVWNIPNVKANHVERTSHPCQFPVELVERCVLALTSPGDRVLDPFVGTGASAIAAIRHGRAATGIDRDEDYIAEAERRLDALRMDRLPLRPLGRPVSKPSTSQRVARLPDEWLEDPEGGVTVGGENGGSQEEKDDQKAVA